MNTGRDQDRFITFEQSEVPLDLQSDFPDGRNPNALSLSNNFPYDLKGVRTDVLKTLELEEYRILAFHTNNTNFVPSHRYKRLKKIFDEIIAELKRELEYYEINIIKSDRSETCIKVLIGGKEIIIELLSWDSILVNGRKYDTFKQYIEGITQKGFYGEDGIEDEGGEPRSFFKISDIIKNKLGIIYEGDYYLRRAYSQQSRTYGYIAIPGDLKEGYLFGSSQCIADGWDIDQFNYNFARRTENRSCFIPQVDFDRVLISLFKDDSK